MSSRPARARRRLARRSRSAGAPADGGTRESIGTRITNVLLIFTGPAQITSPLSPRRDVSVDEAQREVVLRSELTRVTGPDGRAYLVERDDA